MSTGKLADFERWKKERPQIHIKVLKDFPIRLRVLYRVDIGAPWRIIEGVEEYALWAGDSVNLNFNEPDGPKSPIAYSLMQGGDR